MQVSASFLSIYWCICCTRQKSKEILTPLVYYHCKTMSYNIVINHFSLLFFLRYNPSSCTMFFNQVQFFSTGFYKTMVGGTVGLCAYCLRKPCIKCINLVRVKSKINQPLFSDQIEQRKVFALTFFFKWVSFKCPKVKWSI